MGITLQEEITIPFILNWLSDMVKEKKFMDAHQWVETCLKITVLLGEEYDKLFELQQLISKNKVGWIEAGKSATEARLRVEASDIYKDMCKQKALIERATEMIRVAKIQARLKDSEFRNQ